jgi:hypothetical protein
MDCVLIARSPLLQARYVEVETAVTQSLKRAKLLTVSEPTEL